MTDLAQYVGLRYASHGRGPFAFDCWGLVLHFYKQEFRIDLPTLVDGYKSAAKDVYAIAALVLQERARWLKVDSPRYGDAVVLRIGSVPRHVGVIVDAAKNVMLHSLDGHDSALESLAGPKWARRVDGYYHYAR